ncbi:hypothetical protein ACEZCY_33725 [Streptacidiphilus sp. N1-12]|uniref:Uncharacterized protein n=2 Tax=Streptacidiphilus alkalitolerans TaxID=3342712 RepID=A0ABV6VK63_9ACTN
MKLPALLRRPPLPPLPLRSPRSPRSPRSARSALTAGLAAVLLVAGLFTVHNLGHRPSAPRSAAAQRAAGMPVANQRPPLLPAGPTALPPPYTVPAGGAAAPGTRLDCPSGSLPGIMLTEVVFDPPLTGGTDFTVRTYLITVTGQINNETGAALVVSGVTARVRGESWHPRLSFPKVVAPGTSVQITLSGKYSSVYEGPAPLSTDLLWDWQNPALRACGVKGLIYDD